jgi:hypothetical protein
MDLIKDINDTVSEKDAVEAAIEATKPAEPTGKTVADYLTDIQQEKE